MTTETKTILAFVVVAAIISLCVWKCTKPKEPPILITHDTVIKRIFVYDTIKGTTIQIPQRVTYYDTSVRHDTSLRVLILNDTLVITKHDTIIRKISPDFITAFPDAPKLILGEFSKNSISLNLQGIDGHIVTKDYIPNYSKFQYEFSGNELRYIPLPGTTGISGFFKKIKTDAYMSTTYNPFTNGATMRIDGSLMYKRLGLTVFGSFSTDQTPKLNSGIGFRVKMK